MSRFECHCHSHYSNLRLLDCINTIDGIYKRAKELGLVGVCLTDHESLSGHVEVDKIQQQILKDGDTFKFARGNEIYLINDREAGQKYWHFILIARDAIGHKMLRELSSNAWINSYYDRGMERVPTLKTELATVIEKYGKGHLIGSSACLGSEVDGLILQLHNARQIGDKKTEKESYNKLCNFINFCKDLFEDDFYLEVQPAQSKEQLIVNNMMGKIGSSLGVKVIVTTDAHYLRKEDRWVHKAYLQSKEGAREVDEFYESAYLQSTEEVIENLKNTNLDYYELEANTLEIYSKIENYTLQRNQQVPQIAVRNYTPRKIGDIKSDFMEKYPTLTKLFMSDNIQERYWINQCMIKLNDLGLANDEYVGRLEYEADIKDYIGNALGTCMFAYPVFLQHYIDLFWKCGSPVGAGRGSAGAGLNHYLLGITQTDPIKTNAPFWRYLNKSRTELADIDIDLAPSKREQIFEEIRKERGQLGCVQVCTFSTETTKSAIQTACRGYRTENYPDGIDNDIAQYISSLIPVERGFLWSISDVVNGNEGKGRKPIAKFIAEVNKYPGLLEIIQNIEGLIKNRSIHASGVNFYGEDPFETACFMKATNGSIITQYSLHDAEYCSDVKMDFLVTEQMDIIAQCIQLLQENGYIEQELTLRQAYDKYVHPDKLPLKDDKLWDAINRTDILALFQLNTAVGGNIVRQLKPRSVEELTACNGLMRLMGEEGKERPADRYERLKNDISLWYEEMSFAGLSKREQKVMEKYCLADYGAPSSQEILMTILMDEETCGFSLAEANAARKLVAKKQMDKIPVFKEEVLSRCKTRALGEYIWHCVIGPQLGYSFSRIHGYSYSLIGCQSAYLATYFPSVYWNTAYLRVISGLDTEASSDYSKIARGVGDIISHGINVSLIDINKSGYMFEPDESNNSILYGLKALNGVGGEIIEQIIQNRPYSNLEDFIEKNNCNKTVMISLIKSGAFDQFGEREGIMYDYIWSICEPKKRITMQNFNMLNEKNLLPEELSFEKRLFRFNKALKKNCKVKNGYLAVEKNYYEFYRKFFDIDLLSPKDGRVCIQESKWKQLYDNGMSSAKQYLTANKDTLLSSLNETLFQEEWDKYAAGSLSAWEMEALGFYYHEHELVAMKDDNYNVIEFSTLGEEPEIDYTFNRNGVNIPIYKTYRICGTVIAKDDTKSSISLLTKNSGIVNVKFTRDYYSRLNKQISQIGIDGKKHVIEKSFLKRGTLAIINGFRRGNTFVSKSYKKTPSHQFYKITNVKDNGEIEMTYQRADEK